MPHEKFGRLLADLRQEMFDPVTGSRWSQKKLAQVAGLSPRIIATLEQGAKTKLETDMLWRIAQALRLNTLERREFFLLATAPEETDFDTNELRETWKGLLALMGTLCLPALLHDDFFDVLAVNALSVAFNVGAAQSVGITEPFPPPHEHNLLRMLFAPDSLQRRRLAPLWAVMARTCVQLFHCYTLRHRSSPYFQELLKELRGYREFRVFWEEITEGGPHEIATHHPFRIHHPEAGITEWCNSIITTATSLGDLHLSIVLPCNREAFEALSAGLKAVPRQVYALKEWPHLKAHA